MRYAKRIISCTALFITGVLVVALSTALHTRLFGISLASFAGGLGEMTILQLASTLSREDQVSNYAVGWFSSGTGAAGFVGAGLWWFLRALGVRLGLSLTAVRHTHSPLIHALKHMAFQIIPLGYCAAYFLLLPRQQLKAQRKQSYKPVAQEDDDAEVDVEDPEHSQTQAAFLGSAPLSMQSKLDIARPLLLRFMLPLFSVYFA